MLGFSQSMQWYAGRSFADHVDKNSRPDHSALAPDAFLPGWQGRFFLGAAVERWTDPVFPGWSGAHRLVHETPALLERDLISAEDWKAVEAGVQEAVEAGGFFVNYTVISVWGRA